MSAYGAYDDGYDDYDRPISGPQVALIDLLDRLLRGGVVLTGDLVLSIADIDLVRVSLRAVIVAVREEMDKQWSIAAPEPGHDGQAGRRAPALPEPERTYAEGGGHGDTAAPA